MKRLALAALLAAFGVSSASTGAVAGPHSEGESSPAAAPPNVLWIVLDDAGWEDLRGVPMPNLQALGASARAYRRFYVSPVCSPTRYQLQFGRYSHRAFIGAALDPMSDKELGAPLTDSSLAEHLSVAGYRTAFFGKWHVNGKAAGVSAEFPRLHGFETWRAGSPGNLMGGSYNHYYWRRYDDSKASIETTYSSVAVESALQDWWIATEGPKFAVCSFFAPHEPFDLPPNWLLGGYVPGPGGLRANYEAKLVALDTLFGNIASYVDFSNTYVFLLPDNGTPHQVPPPGGQYQGYKLTVYEGGIRVPLYVWGPEVLPGVDDHLVQVTDLPRTVLELAGLRPRIGFEDSISFRDTLSGGAGQRPFAFLQRFRPNSGTAPWLDFEDWAVVRADGWKLIGRMPFPGFPTLHSLYYLPADPFEQQGFGAQQQPQVFAELKAIRDQVLGPIWPY